MANYIPGFYWCKQHSNSQRLTIARLTKNGWEYFHSEHSSKAVRNSPHKVLDRIDLPENLNVKDFNDD